MRILGISCFYHDAAAALLVDGRLVAASEEERFTRVKHDPHFPENAIAFCLAQAGLNAADLDYVVFYERPLLKFERLLTCFLHEAPRSAAVFPRALSTWLSEKLWIRARLQERLGVPGARILFSDHHLSHAASAFLCSPFESAAVLTVDGVGEWATASLGLGTSAGGKTRLKLLAEMRFPHSLGLLYSAFTALLGFEVNEGEYKVMGLASYGEPRYRDRVDKVARLFADGSLELDLSYFSFPYHPSRTYHPRFAELFGGARGPGDEFDFPDSPPAPGPRALSRERSRRFADVAASIQDFTEEALLRMCRELHERTGETRLCMAGGVAFNSVANYRILRETPFRELFIQPAAGDAGGALGAALFAENVVLGNPRRFTLPHAYWGRGIEAASAAETLRASGLKFRELGSEDALVASASGRLLKGEVVGWAQGRSEWGPRALGNRSILADPRGKETKRTVNLKVKYREPFRPFAPSVLEEAVGDWFHLPKDRACLAAPYMLLVAPFEAGKGEAVPAVRHVDGTGRLQTVSKRANPLYAKLIGAFQEGSGVPMVLNTSFNLKGEPIVDTPQDAINTFKKSGLDALYLGPFEATKA